MSRIIIGIDEVGRGCWAGPMVIGAVSLSSPIEGLRDSKCLTAIKRQFLSEIIYESASIANLGWVSAAEIDELGLTKATTLGIMRAISDVDLYDEIIIDGAINYLPNNKKVKTLVKADDLVPAVSAASIIAKVARDNYMKQQALNYPMYLFDRHVGYGTRAHKEALDIHGVCPLHRLSYKPVSLALQRG